MRPPLRRYKMVQEESGNSRPGDQRQQQQQQQQQAKSEGRGGRGNHQVGRGQGRGGRGRQNNAGGRGTPQQGRGAGGPATVAPTSGVPYGHVPGYLPGSSSLVEELDKRVLIVLRDGRHLVGVSASCIFSTEICSYVLKLLLGP